MKLERMLWIPASILLANASFGEPAGTPHYPDLVTLPPFDIGIEYDSISGKKLLRFSNAVANLGEGPLDVIPVNNATTGTTEAYQRLYSHDTNGNWYVAATNHIGTFVFHPAHNHWHFENFARYELHNVAADGSVGPSVFAAAEKVSFCLVDDVFLDPVAEHAATRSYTNCGQLNPQGISVGWVDVYPWTLPDQDLDITGVPDGDYWLVSTADPGNLISESSGATENNNTAVTKVHIGSELLWVDDALPEGAATGVAVGDSWKWINSNPAPFSGALAHQSAVKTGKHEHFFDRATDTLSVNTNNALFTYVYLDPINPPTEVMLQWTDLVNSAHRAYWGSNSIPLGTNGTASLYSMGELPPAGQWVRLEVPARLVGLEGHSLRGMYFTLQDGRATWDYSGLKVAPPFPGSTPPSLTNTAVPPTVSDYTPSPLGVRVDLADGTAQVKPDTIQLTFDGEIVGTAISKTGAVTTIKYDLASPLAPDSGHLVRLDFADTATPSVAQSFPLDVVVPNYGLVPPEFATAAGAVDQTRPGFKIRPYETEANNPDSLAWTEDQLDGLKGPNLANLAGADTSGFYARETVINFDFGAGAGNFPDDDPFPGLPGTGTRDGGTGNSAIEVLTFLEFPNPGVYVMGVNSDDGFRVTTGANALDKFSVKLGEFDGARGPLDTLFNLVVPQAGIYPFRLIWQNGGGSGNVEWFTVTNRTKVLVNDTNTPGAIRAYREGSGRAYVKAVSPLPDSVDVPGNSSISVVLADEALQVQIDSIQLFLNGQPLAPATDKVGGITTVTYIPPTKLAPESTNTVRLVYADNASPPHVITNEFSFVVAPDFDVLIGINETQLWRYNQSGSDLGTGWKDSAFNDSSWSPGAALFEGKNGMLPPLPETNRTALTVTSSKTTYYFRTHFNFTGNPAGARLRMRYIIDDGAVFYLNGTEIHRVGMPVGPIAASTLAARTVVDAVYEGPVDLPVRSLVAGDNVLAVEVHQSSITSSDITMGVQLISITSNPVRTTIASTSPAPDAVDVLRNSAIDITLGDGTRMVQPGSIQLFLDGQLVTPIITKPAGSPWTEVAYLPAQMPPAETKVTVKLVFNDDATPPNVTTKEYSFTTAPEITVLIDINDKRQIWRYDESGLDLGSAWKEKGFDDASWKSGAALFEGKRGTVPTLPEPVGTFLTPPTNKTTFYFRTHFNFTGDPTATKLKIKTIIDDGAVFYLNGNEVFRLGMPGGPITASTLASRSINDAVYEGPFDIPSTGLASRDNVLAVEVHQTLPTSSDITAAVQLFMLGSLPKFSPIALVGTNLTIEWSGSWILQSAEAVTGPWTVVTNASSPFTTTAAGAAQFYRLTQ